MPPDIHAFSWPPQSSQRNEKLCERVAGSDWYHTGIRVYRIASNMIRALAAKEQFH